jgi:hypothetical protein
MKKRGTCQKKKAATACRQKRLQGTATPSQDSGRAGKTGHKKRGFFRISLTLMPDNLFVAACIFSFLGTARLGRIALLGAAGFGRVTCLGIALRVAAGASRSFGCSSGSPALGSLLVRITAAAYHCYGSHDNNKRKNLFHKR